MVQVSSQMYSCSMELYEFESTNKFTAWKIWKKLKNFILTFNTLTVISFLTFKCFYAILKSFFTEKTKGDPICKEKCNKTDKHPDIKSNEDHSIRPFEISVSDKILVDLKMRLEGTRYEDPLEDSAFKNGFNSIYLQKITKYWITQYEWRKCEKELNKYPQFKTNINGLDVHFVHVKPMLEKRKLKVIPLLLIHGWPGSSANFCKLISLLTDPHTSHDFVFQVICPSIPGFGFSDAPFEEGFNGKDVARILLTLMHRLGFSQFYVQGCDLGSVIASLMGRCYPSRVKGVHVDMCFSLPKSFDSLIKFILITVFPFLISPVERRTIFPLKKKLRTLWEETGSCHIQSTKPDTIGCAMADSPAGMAAYFLEKFFARNPDNLVQPNRELLGTFKLDELLTMVTICWVNNNFTSGARFFKENINDVIHSTYERLPLTVPVGVAVFPNQDLMLPKWIMEQQMEDLVTYTIMSTEQHFVAMQEHQLLANDLRQFVQIVEGR